MFLIFVQLFTSKRVELDWGTFAPYVDSANLITLVFPSIVHHLYNGGIELHE